MPYSLIIDTKAGKELVKFPRDAAKRIFNKIQETKENPFHYWKRLERRRDYKLRIGDYRAIADISKERNLIEVTKLGHRKEIYQR